MEKTGVFFYPSQWNCEVGKTPRHNQEKSWVLLQHHQPPQDPEHPSRQEVRHGVTHPTVQVQFAGTHANRSFCFGLCGLIPFWVLISYRLHNSKQSQPNQCVLPGFRLKSLRFAVFICNHKLAQVHSNLGPSLYEKNYSFFHHSRPERLGLLQPPPTPTRS